jgi:outer membrane autotransporter protein
MVAAMGNRWRSGRTSRRAAMLPLIAAALVTVFCAGPTVAQVVVPPTISGSFSPPTVTIGSNSDLTFTVTNPNPVPLTNVRFGYTAPAGIDLITQLGGTCSTLATGGGMFSINPGADTFSSQSNVLAGGQACSIIVRVRPTATGAIVNTSSTVTSNEAAPGGPASATLTSNPPAVPTLTKAFGAASIPIGSSTSLSFTIRNPNASTALTGVAFTDTFPSGVVVATPNALTSSCGGTSTAAAGGGNFALSGVSLAANASCTVSLNVTGTAIGTKVNTTSTVASNEAAPGAAATATLTVNPQTVTTTALTSSLNPSASGQAVTFRATVTGTSPTGTATFKDGSTVLGTGTLSAGVATFTTSSLAVGSHSITVSYGGDAVNLASTSAVLTQSVGVPVDSIKLRALQLAVTKIEAQSSGAAISGAVDNAISEGFSNNGAPITGSGNGMRFNFAAEPQESEKSQKPSVGERVGDTFAAFGYAPRDNVYKAPPPPRVVPKEWLAWAEVRGTDWNTSLQTGDIKGGQTNALIGLTRKLSPDFLVGAFGGYERFDYTSQLLSGRLKGDGWTAGGYLGWRLTPGLRFDAGVARSGISYDGVAGAAAGTFPGQRWLATAALIGTIKAIGFEIEPSAKVYGLWEHNDNYSDSLGTVQGERNFSTGRASIGTKVAYPWMWSATAIVTPYVGLYADYYFNQDDGTLPGTTPLLLPTEFVHGLSARLTSGIAVAFASGPKLSLGGELGGLGSNQFTTWSVRGRASAPFSYP